jgi:rfaE bifunctional protein kinase chain/domain
VLAGFSKLKIGLVGDLFLDRYLDIDSELRELSVETGLEAYQVTRVRNSPGALGTVMSNLAALGVGRLVPVTVIGDDGQAYDLVKELGRLPVETAHVLRDATRQTPTYTKPMKQDAQGIWQELNRLDLRNRAPLSREIEDAVLRRLTEVFRSTDGLIVLDQVNEEGWGVVGPRVREHLADLADQEPSKLIFVDSRARIGKFRRGVLKPNLAECLRALGQDDAVPSTATCSPDDRLARAIAAAAQLVNRTGCQVFCTLGEQGIVVAEQGTAPRLAPAFSVAGPIDPVGAGDSATSGIVATLLSGATPLEAATLGNLVASITVTQLGTTGTASPDQLIAKLTSASP